MTFILELLLMQQILRIINIKVQEITINRKINRDYALHAGQTRRLQLNRAFNRWTRLIERVIARPRVIARNARVTGRKSFARFPRARKREAGARLARGAAQKRAGKNHARRERLARVRRVTSLSRPSQSIATAFARPPRLPAHPDVSRASLRRPRLRRVSLPRPPCRSGPPRLCFPTSAVHASPRRLPRLCSPRLPAPSAAPFWSAVRGRERSAAARGRASPSPPLTPPWQSVAAVPPCLPVRRPPWYSANSHSGNPLFLSMDCTILSLFQYFYLFLWFSG